MPKLMKKPTLSPADVGKVVTELQSLQRRRAIILKSRNMQATRLQAIVAGTLGYDANKLDEKARKKKFEEASTLINQVVKGEAKSELDGVILTTMTGINAFNEMKATLEKIMVQFAKRLPVAEWVEAEEQRGFGLLFLAIVIGETGNLCNYANPAKVWRRLGCAPWTFNGKTRMGATWKSGKEGKLPAAEWEQFGYSPRRRSIAYLIGAGAVKQNGDGPYRVRYDTTKVLAKKNHPDWSDLRCHMHGMLLASKLLLKNLWIEWNKQ